MDVHPIPKFLSALLRCYAALWVLACCFCFKNSILLKELLSTAKTGVVLGWAMPQHVV